MQFNIKEIRPRNILTILAEIATILSLILAWIMYRDSQAASTTTSEQLLNPVLLIFVLVNVVMCIFLSFSMIKSIFIRVHQKQHQLYKKFISFSKSTSTYLFNMKQQKSDEYTALIDRTKKH